MIAHQWRCKHEVIENASSLKNPLIGLPRFPRNHAGERTTVANQDVYRLMQKLDRQKLAPARCSIAAR
jgi:hypothetical protein